MNIEIANRLLQLRKEHKFSQEDLAAKLNISRQAVSKWERAEASPDTDNLIELSKLYGISLDTLLTGAQESEKAAQPAAEDAAAQEPADQPDDAQGEDEVSFRRGIHMRSADGDKVDIGFNGVHMEDKNGEKVHVGFGGVHITEKSGSHGHHGKYWNRHDNYDWDEQYKKQKPYKFWYSFPYPLVALILFFAFGLPGGWAWSWIFFLTIPLYYTSITAIQKSNLKFFCYPVLAAAVFFMLGFWGDLWHPGWIVFLTIPFYYWLAELICPSRRNKDGTCTGISQENGDHPDML